jgi:hypothetical protein
VVDPTLSTFAFIAQRDGEVSLPYAAVAEHLPPDVRRYVYFGGMDIPDEATALRNRRSYAKMIEFVGRLYRAGVPIVAGTDAWPGITLPGELGLYAQAGLTAAQVLQVATRNGALYTRTSADRGSIEVGKLADLILVDGDPTRDIGDIYKIALVLTQGHWIAPPEVHAELGLTPFVANPPAVRDRARPAAAPDAAGAGRPEHSH